MKILHTADWHLGQNFYGRDRLQEQQVFLEFLLATIESKKVDVLLVAGDIFDTANPPRAAEQLYFDFITKLYALGHCEAIIVGGNHDSAAQLEAPRSILSHLRTHVVGALPEDLSQAVFRFEKDGRKLCVAALPFLRDRDVRRAVEGESFDAMEARTKAGIVKVYRDMAELAAEGKVLDEIIIASGHLTAVGGEMSDGERSIHIGKLGSIGAEQLGPGFDYVALGHLHHPQVVGGDENIRHSGSPIPLSFAESDKKELRLLTITQEYQLEHEAIAVPLARRMLRFCGSLDEVLGLIGEIKDEDDLLDPWIEVTISEGEVSPAINDQIREEAAKKGAQVLKVGRQIGASAKGEVALDSESIKAIDEWEPQGVFEKKIENYQGDVEPAMLEECFNHVMNAVQEEDAK